MFNVKLNSLTSKSAYNQKRADDEKANIHIIIPTEPNMVCGGDGSDGDTLAGVIHIFLCSYHRCHTLDTN